MFNPQGRNQKIILFGFWFKQEQENLLLKFTDLYELTDLMYILYTVMHGTFRRKAEIGFKYESNLVKFAIAKSQFVISFTRKSRIL